MSLSQLSITSLSFPPTILSAYLSQTLAFVPLNLSSTDVPHNDPLNLAPHKM